MTSELKTCRICREEKPEGDFYLRQDGKLHNACKACLRARRAENYAQNRERIRAAARIRYASNPGPARAQARGWYAANPGRARLARREWRAANPDLDQLATARKRARKMSAPGCGVTRAEWQDIRDRFGNRCAYCGTMPLRLTQDHLTPLSRGGSHAPENIVPACRSCNSRKSAKTLWEFVSYQAAA